MSGRPVWLSRDPIGEAGGINLYGYVGNNPINAVDPHGLFLVSLAFIGYDSYQFLTGQINGTDYALRMGVNGAALAVDFVSGAGGSGYLLAARGGQLALRGAKVLSKADAINAAGHVAMNMSGGKWLDDSDNCPSGFEKMAQGNNQHPKKQFEEALKRLGLANNSDQARRLHEAITGRGMKSVDEIVEAGKDLGYGR